MYSAGRWTQFRDKGFFAIGTGGGLNYGTCTMIPFNIPNEASMVSMTLIGPGGGGCSGEDGVASPRGGGGGGCGNITTSLYSARFLPKTIFIYLPDGSTGGTTAFSPGSATQGAVITLSPLNTTTLSPPATLSFAATGTRSSSAAGTAPGNATTTSVVGCWQFALSMVTGSISGTGSNGAAAGGVALNITSLLSGGAGGGGVAAGVATSGGSIFTPTTANNHIRNNDANSIVVGGGAPNTKGAPGLCNFYGNRPFSNAASPFYACGGSGGGGAVTGAVAGAGGKGAPGCGGGGGGGGVDIGSFGAGGDGGPSCVFIEWW